MKRFSYLSGVLLFSVLIFGAKINSYSQTVFNYTGAIEQYTVPAGVTSIQITANGAQGGDGWATGGLGAIMSGEFVVTPGHVLNILVGEKPATATYTGGGGGGTFVWDVTAGNTLLIAAGGGGGCGTGSTLDNGLDAVTTNNGTGGGESFDGGGTGGNGATAPTLTPWGLYAGGGAGWITDGNVGNDQGFCSVAGGGSTPLNGGAGGVLGGNTVDNTNGGFGGGGGAQGYCDYAGGGGGGGYSGGAGGVTNALLFANPGGGGGSYNIGTAQANSVGNTGNGSVSINAVPYYVLGSNQNVSVCDGSTLNDITARFVINDGDNGQTITWSVFSAPTNGTLSTFPVVGTSNGGALTPSTITYTPASIGTDEFVIEVNDGAGGVAYDTINVTIHAVPNVNNTADQPVCNGAMTTAVNFTGSLSLTNYDWTNTGFGTGLTTTGTGDIAAFTAVNGSFSPKIDTIIVTPERNGCYGIPDTFMITINPTPDVTVPGNSSHCNNTATTATTFTSNVSGTTYTWTNSNSSIGLATTGSSNIASFTATNSGTAPIAGVISVTPKANNCVGSVQSYTLTVKPTPVLNPSFPATELCYNTLFHYVPSSLTTGTTYTWTRDTVIGIGNPITAGADSVHEILVNNDTLQLAVPYVITLTAASCTNTQTITVTSNPELLLSSTLTPDSICNNTLFSYTPKSRTPLTTFQWNRNPVYGISNAGATNSFDPLETLNDTLPTQVLVTYNYNIILNACSNTQDVEVKVNPTPKLTTTLTPTALCDSTAFTYGPASATPGTTFAWSRGTNPDFSNLAKSGVDTIRDTLVNITTAPKSATFAVTLSAYGCSNTQNVVVSVNPRPWLSSLTTPPAICDKDTLHYVPASLTVGTTFTWSRAAVLGLSNPAKSGTGIIHEALFDTTANPVTVVYIDTLDINGCKNTDSVYVVVKPTPRLSSLHKPAPICDGKPFNYTPASKTIGTTFNWTRPYVLGIDLVAGTGSDNPNEELKNTTNFNASVVYVYTLTANGCTFYPDSVTVVVRPTPKLSSDLTVTTCSNAPFTYVPESFTPSTSFKWKRALVTGILPATSADSGIVKETLVDTTKLSINAIYTYTLTVNGCTNIQNVVVKVDPAPAAPLIAITSPSSVCSNTRYQNFGAATPPANGISYIWSAINASIMATGTNKQNALITFNNPGAAKVILTTNIGATSCKNTDTFDVAVGTGVSDNPNVIYYNGQFICLQNDVTSYQWGFDDALTLDSTLVPGEVNQVYFNSAPDLIYRYYWLITNRNGCMQKSYYNVPTGITNINGANVNTIKVYPNPTSSNINVEVNSALDGNIQVEVSNLLGQKVSVAQATDHKATIDVSSLPAGCYLVDCYRDGVKIATSKFIKN